MINRLLLLATLLGIANTQSCYQCDNSVSSEKCSDGAVVKSCTGQSDGKTCANIWTNQDIKSQGCTNAFQIPADAKQCGPVFKCKTERSETTCFCTGENCNKNNTFPTNCKEQSEEQPENGAEGKVGAVLSIVLSAIFATVF